MDLSCLRLFFRSSSAIRTTRDGTQTNRTNSNVNAVGLDWMEKAERDGAIGSTGIIGIVGLGMKGARAPDVEYRLTEAKRTSQKSTAYCLLRQQFPEWFRLRLLRKSECQKAQVKQVSNRRGTGDAIAQKPSARVEDCCEVH